MSFAFPLPWWLTAGVAVAILALTYLAYRRPLSPLSRTQRLTLMTLRGLALAALVIFFCRPVVRIPPASDEIVVPILVDVSRSMRVSDADGQTRMARAAQLLDEELLGQLKGQFRPEIYSVGDAPAPADVGQLRAHARQSYLTDAVASIRARYRGQRVAGVVLLSDGAETGQHQRHAVGSTPGPPVFTVGIGAPEGVRDREVVAITAGDPRLDQATVDLRVAAVSHGFDRAPFDLRILANGRLTETRRVTPAGDGAPIEEVFTVTPDPLVPTVFAASISTDGEETIIENDTRSVLVNPPGRPRLVLVLQGAPGFDHSYLSRVWARDPGLEIDSVVRKGRDEAGKHTFLVQAAPGRTAALTSGFPSTVEALYKYDAVLVANIEGDYFTAGQLEQLADFVAERGGGLLVFGGRSFAQRGLIGTALEAVLPLELDDRRGGVAQTSFDADQAADQAGVRLTRDGALHPIMRLGGAPADSPRLWSALPALPSSAALGGPRPGASILAVTSSPNGATQPLIAVQRYGRGRSMVFAGEASWRWRMLMPSTDRTYEYFWRQAVRWLAAPAPTPVAVTVPDTAEPEDSVEISVEARDGVFAPVEAAVVDTLLTPPAGEAVPIPLRREADGAAGFTAAFQPDRAGLYRVQVEARHENRTLGSADSWFYVGGSDREFADPRLNEGFLRRLAESSGGQYVHARDAGELVSWLKTAAAEAPPRIRDLWHRPWTFALVLALLSAEWILRRRWGLR